MARFSIIAVATAALLPSATMAFVSTTPSGGNTALFSKNAQDQPRSAPSWTQSSAPATATAVVDSPSSSAGSAATEDTAPNQVNLWTNVLDTPRGQKQRDLPKWARQS